MLSPKQRGYLFAHHPPGAQPPPAMHPGLPAGGPGMHPQVMHSGAMPMGHAAPPAATASGWLGMKTGQQLQQQAGGHF